MTTHAYHGSLTWTGSSLGYDSYDRAHRVDLGDASLNLSADAAFGGDATVPNPEQLLVAAASSCQLLSFLAVASRAGVEIVHYDDRPEGTMPMDVRPVRLSRIVLRPHVVARGTTEERVGQLLQRAHDECYVAHSLRTDVVLEPTVEIH